jgi:hypothetical protein
VAERAPIEQADDNTRIVRAVDLRDRIPPWSEHWGEFGKEIESANSVQLFAIIGWSVLASAMVSLGRKI